MRRRKGGFASREINIRRQVKKKGVWHISARLYRWSYRFQVTLDAVNDMLSVLRECGHVIRSETIADCGCGPGIITEMLLDMGARPVVAIDDEEEMMPRVRALLKQYPRRLIVRRASYEGDTLPRINYESLKCKGFDVVVFKSSLYVPRARAIATLRRAFAVLKHNGTIIIVHPEKDWSRYVFGEKHRLTKYSLFHIGNRLVSLWKQAEYQLYTKAELLSLAREALPYAKIEEGATTQLPYNILTISNV